MINIINYEKIRRIILKKFVKQNVFVYIKGLVNTRTIINKARTNINKDKIIFANDDNNITIDLFNVRKVKIEDNLRITLTYSDDLQVSLEV